MIEDYEDQEQNELVEEFENWCNKNYYEIENYYDTEYSIYTMQDRENDSMFLCNVEVEDSMKHIMEQLIEMPKYYYDSKSQEREIKYLAKLAKEYLEEA